MLAWEDFRERVVGMAGARIFVRHGGTGAAVLLLHGFPQTQWMWRKVAPLLASRLTVVCADLPGYGRSDCPASAADHAPYSKRAMASQLVKAMAALGFDTFGVVGHDRGGRVAYRLALDFPRNATRVAVLDVLPVAEAWERADKRFATSYWPWSLLAQAAPLPERLISAAPDAVVDDALSQWGSTGSAFDATARAAYIEPLRDPAHVHAICEEYRAAATIDHEHDSADRGAGRMIECPLLSLWSRGALDEWYHDAGGPLAIWRRWARDVRGEIVEGGHFFPEANPAVTAELLADFLRG